MSDQITAYTDLTDDELLAEEKRQWNLWADADDALEALPDTDGSGEWWNIYNDLSAKRRESRNACRAIRFEIARRMASEGGNS